MSNKLKKCSQAELLKKNIADSSQRVSNPWPSRYRLDALTNWAMGDSLVSKVIQLGSNVTHALLAARLNNVKVIKVNV